jgi:probable O-glycosylation ligase (exosortase A-associated)
MLRMAFVFAIVAFGITQAMRGPFYALLFYLWIAYFRPEMWVWSDFVASLNLSLIVGVFVVIRTLFSQEKIRFGVGPCLMFIFLTQSLISTLSSSEFDYAWRYFTEFAKATVICVLIISLVTDERRLRLALLIIAISLGFEAAKQGWAQFIMNPGGQNDNEVVILGDNNAVAVGMYMLVPIILALGRTATTRWERFGHRFAAVGVLYRAIVTYSRGGFLACGAIGLHYLLRSKRKVGALIGIAVVAGLIVPVLPDRFWSRMDTIPESTEEIDESDNSIKGRIHFWHVAVRMANDHPLLGVGHNSFNKFYDRYDFSNGLYKRNRSVHSSWFGLLSELGYPGLLLFVVILIYAFWQCRRVRRLSKTRPDLANLAVYASAIEAALLAFTVGGSFVIFHYNEMLWHTFALSMAVGRIAHEKQPSTQPAVATEQASVPVRLSAALAPVHRVRTHGPLTS